MSGLTVDDLVSRLRSAGVRITTPRRMVLVALLSSGSHVTAEELHRRVCSEHPEVSVSSIYRTMDLLADHGVVEHVHLGHGPAQYHLADEHHAHLVCNRCSAIIELDESVSTTFADAVARELGFDVDLGHFALTGWCTGCRPDDP
ncbi:MAG: Fur family transcriptional regulator [Acidimicrobiales bacterium]